MLNFRQRSSRRPQTGLSIVELLVGVAIGLVVVAAAALLMTSQLVENRKLLVETQLQQDLRAASDIVTRELRRVGARQEFDALDTIWYPGTPEVKYNYMAPSLALSSGQVNFNYDPGITVGPYGFRLPIGSGVLQTLIGASGWQDLTDTNVMKVLSFVPTLTLASVAPIQLPCPKLCPDGTSDCWPRFQVRELQIEITAEARSDPAIKRSILSRARVRNDYVLFADPGLDRMCPV